MKRIQKILLIGYLVPLMMALSWVVINENDVFEILGTGHADANQEFIFASLMEILTICVIPVALRLFKFRCIRNAIKNDNDTHLRMFLICSLVRLEMILLPMLANVVFYYLFMNVAFGYMGIILFLSACFILPTKARCEDEYAAIANG